MNKRIVRLTESDLHRIVENTVYNILAENENDEFFGGLGRVAKGIGSALGRGAKGAAKGIGQGVRNAGNAVGDAAGQMYQGAKDMAGKAGQAIGNAAGAVGQGVKNAAGAVGRGAQSAANAVGQGVKNAAGAVGQGVQNAAGAVKGMYQAGEAASNISKASQLLKSIQNSPALKINGNIGRQLTSVIANLDKLAAQVQG